MADKVAEKAHRKMYELVYSRGTTGRFKPFELPKDDDLIIGSLPKEISRKVVSKRSSSIRYRPKEILSEHCIAHKGKESTETITMKGKSKEMSSKCKKSQTGEGVPIGSGQVDIDTVQKADNKSMNTLKNRKRGADGEIVRTYLLSPQKSLCRLRPRKEASAFRMVNLEENDNEFVVGKRVKVYWSGSRRWFTGRIVAFDNNKRLHSILYEDGDEEVLDLTKERFELEVMPADHFKLEHKPCSARKADELDTGNVKEDVMKEDSRTTSGAKSMTKVSESKQKKEAKNKDKRTNLKAHREDPAVIMEDLATNVDMIPKIVGEIVINRASGMERLAGASSEEDESNLFSVAPKEATKEFEAEATVMKSLSESMGSDNSSIKESGRAVEDDSLKMSIAELAKKSKSSRKILMPKVKRMRTNRAFGMEFGNVVENLEANMKSHVHYDEIKTTQMDVDINSEAMEVSYQNIRRKNETPERKRSEGDETSYEASLTTLDLTSKKKTVLGSGNVSINAANVVENLTKTENSTSTPDDVVAGLLLGPHSVKDEMPVPAAQMEFTASIKTGEDESITGITNAQRSVDVYSMNANHEAESILDTESLKPCEASSQLQLIVQISPEEAKPNVLLGEVRSENGESDQESKQGTEFISEKLESMVAREAQSIDSSRGQIPCQKGNLRFKQVSLLFKPKFIIRKEVSLLEQNMQNTRA
ncbi:hypothetical protein PTKIN_Ptkin03bG0104100 [Pterospermum kingtungense]